MFKRGHTYAGTLSFAALVISLGLSTIGASAQAPTVTDLVSTVINDSANSANFATGVVLFERATITGTPSAFGFIRQGTTNESLFTRPDSINPNFFSTSLPYAGPSTLTGPWTFHVSSSSATSSFNTGSPTLTLANTPAVGSVGIMPFVQSMTISGSSPLNPSISWVLPSTAGTDAFGTPLPSISQVVIGVLDNTNTITRTNVNPFATTAVVPFGQSFQQANQIYSSGPFLPTTTTFAVPSTNDNPNNANFGAPVLQFGHTYSIAISLQNVTGAPPVPGCPCAR